jgi:6-phosphogluconolactonase/glucosamine-6-phosphate isomerase/deaminase
MQEIQVDDRSEMSRALGERLIRELGGGRVLWLVCGGSNIPLSVEALGHLRKKVSIAMLSNLTIALTDERYGDVGHADSNWQQLIDAGFSLEGVSSIPVLTGGSLEETVAGYTVRLNSALESATVVVGQFGLGGDGHIAGILPESPAVNSPRLIQAYDAPPYTRITITPRVFEHIQVAYAGVFGEEKREVLERLRGETLPIPEMPAQILKQLPEAYLFSDQL